MNRRGGFAVVDDFEEALGKYTGAPYVVATDSCTNALLLCLEWQKWRSESSLPLRVMLPKHTYVGVLRAVENAGCWVGWTEHQWKGMYRLWPHPIWDSAKFLGGLMYFPKSFICLSFHWSKRLAIGRGGAILLDDPEARDWLRSARMDGRMEGEDYTNPVFQETGWHCNMDPAAAADGLQRLVYIDDHDKCDWSEYPDISECV